MYDLEELFETQRVFTPEEYAFLGYQPKGEIPPDFEKGTELSFDLGIAYRADTKEEYYIDLGSFLLNPTWTTLARLVFLKD